MNPLPPTNRSVKRICPVPRKEATDTKKLTYYDLPMRSQYEPEWKAILRETGYPTNVVVLDFETYFDEDHTLKGKNAVSTIEYITDDQFEILGWSWLDMNESFVDYEKQTTWSAGLKRVGEILRMFQRIYGKELQDCTVVVYNARFDITILKKHFGVVPKHIIDVFDLARHWQSRIKNSLADVAHRFGLPEKGDTNQFKGWTRRKNRIKKTRSKKSAPPVFRPVITPEDEGKLAEYANNDVMRTWEAFTLLLPKLSDPRTELACMRHTLDMYLHPCLQVDPDKAGILVQRMESEIDSVVKLCGDDITRKDLSGTISFEELMDLALTRAGDDIRNYQKQGKKKLLLAIAKDDPEKELLEKHEDEFVRNLINARSAIKSWPLHIARVRRIIRQGTANDKIYRPLSVPLNYYGAHTGRWSGAERINLQNLGSRGHELVNAVRELLMAPYKHDLVICDAAQIEARMLAWVADQADLLIKFRNSEEIYCGFASRVLGWTVRKPKDTGGIRLVEAKHKWARNSIGKVGILGCGYGMGATRAEEYAEGAIDFDTAQNIVNVYRSENPQIVQFWYALEKAFTYTAKYSEPCELNGLSLHSRSDCDVVITLPNGRELKYHEVRVTRSGIEVYNSLEKYWGRTWGGSLVENVVQAMSRDILWRAISKLEQLGYHTALHVHDEIIMVVPKGTGKTALAKAIEVMSTPPAWAKDLPLNAEGLVTNRYGGH